MDYFSRGLLCCDATCPVGVYQFSDDHISSIFRLSSRCGRFVATLKMVAILQKTEVDAFTSMRTSNMTAEFGSKV